MVQRSIMSVVTQKKSDGTVTCSNSFIFSPKPRFTGGEMKWYQDTYKQPGQKEDLRYEKKEIKK